MMDDKNIQNNQDLRKLLRKSLILFILAGILLACSIAAFIVSTFFLVDESKVMIGMLIFGAGDTLSMGAIVLVIFGYMYRRKAAIIRNVGYAFNQTKQNDIVNVKEAPKTEEQKRKESLIEQYENLYKNGLITKEDFEKRKEEILK